MDDDSNTKKVSISLMGASGKMGRALFELIEEDPLLEYVQEDGDVWIDFSSNEGTKKAISKEAPLVCGTTNLSLDTRMALENLSLRVPVIYSPNFSLGMALLFQACSLLSKKLKNHAEIFIHESHHLEKKDTPSGTALHLAALLDLDPNKIISKRKENVCGLHDLNFNFGADYLVMRHEALSRKAFAHGALTAAKFLVNKPAKLYTLSDIFD